MMAMCCPQQPVLRSETLTETQVPEVAEASGTVQEGGVGSPGGGGINPQFGLIHMLRKAVDQSFNADHQCSLQSLFYP